MSFYLTNIAKKAALQASSAHQRLYIKTSSLCDTLIQRSLIRISQEEDDWSNNFSQKKFYHIQRIPFNWNYEYVNVTETLNNNFLRSDRKSKFLKYNSSLHALTSSYCHDNLLSSKFHSIQHNHFRPFHISLSLQESKVGETLEAIKETIKKEQETKQPPLTTVPETAPIDVTNTATSSTISTPIAPIPSAPSVTITTTTTPVVTQTSTISTTPQVTSPIVTMMPSNVQIRLIPSSETSLIPKTAPKPSLVTRIINELKHYYHGFRLLFIDFRVAIRLIWAVMNGKTLMRREKKQLVRTTADLFRLVPFLVFVIVPFAEFLLPVVLKFFPGMLPSTFKEENREQDKKRKRLKLKLEMAKFLQDTIEETALQRKDARGESVHEFVDFMTKIRTSGVQTSNEEILKFSKLFEDSLTLDNLNNAQLRAMCQILDITPVGPSYILRFQLEMKLRELEADDKMIQQEGLDGMAIWELQDACRQRGMRSFGVPENRLKTQLLQWLDLHLNMKIPTSLLLLSRTLYFPEHISTEDQLKATILALPDTLTEEAKVKILEKTGDRVDNKSKLEVIKQEEMLIKMEKLEVEEVKEEKLEAEKVQPITSPGVKESAGKIFIDQPTSLDQIIAKEEVHTKDIEKLEQVLEMVVDSKSKLTAEVEELKNLKEEFTEYKENLDQLKGVIESSAAKGETPLVGLEESKAARRLTKKVEKMIAKLDSTVEILTAETKRPTIDKVADATTTTAASPKVPEHPSLKDAVDETMLGRLGDNVPDLTAKEMLEKHETMVKVSELLGALESLKKDPTSHSKYELITKILDEDQDGLISYQEASRFMELLGGENLKIGPEKMADIVKTLRKEKEVMEVKKLLKQQQLQQQQQQYRIPQIPDPTGKAEDTPVPQHQTILQEQQTLQQTPPPPSTKQQQMPLQQPPSTKQQQILDNKPKP